MKIQQGPQTTSFESAGRRLAPIQACRRGYSTAILVPCSEALREMLDAVVDDFAMPFRNSMRELLKWLAHLGRNAPVGAELIE